jgi:hypothetical protein
MIAVEEQASREATQTAQGARTRANREMIYLDLPEGSRASLRALAVGLGYLHARGVGAPMRLGSITQLFAAIARGDLEVIRRAG